MVKKEVQIMYQYNANSEPMNNVVGNDMFSDDSFGYKEEVKGVLEAYSRAGVNLVSDMLKIITDPDAKSELISTVTESLVTSPVYTDPRATKAPFYNNYGQRVEQLLSNSMKSVAQESAMIGYAPIVSYNPFFLKKFWVENVFKDILMTEVPKSPVINLAFEKTYIVDQDKNEYPLPESLYDDVIAKKLMDKATGINISEEPIAITNFKPALNVLTSAYFPGLVDGDKTAELTPDIQVCKVILTDTEDGKAGTSEDPHATYEIPCSIRTDITTHNFVKGEVKYDVKDSDGEVLRTISDELIGSIDFKNGTITLFSKNDKIAKVCLRGKLANRWNYRSLDVTRRVEQIQHTMPESGPRLNSAITVEDAADALALQNIDQIAFNADLMGKTLANLEDADIKMFLFNSFQAQEDAGVGPHGYEKLTVKGSFDALPYDGYTRNVTDWMKDSREYFERIIGQLKTKLKTSDLVIVAVCHPNIIRFLQDGISWVFTDDTQISGVKLSYNFGIYTSAQDRVHIITSQKMSEDNGIQFIAIPLTPQLVTFKHYVYNMIIDRNYRNPMYTLVPNIMTTMRMLTFEVLPVQGHMDITGRELFSPVTLQRA